MTHNKSENTPDTEWEKEFDEKWKLMREGGFGKHASIDGRMIWEVSDDEDSWTFADDSIKSFIKSILSSRDTYWKERVRKEVQEQKAKDVELVRTSGWHLAEKLARRILGGADVKWYTQATVDKIHQDHEAELKKAVEEAVEKEGGRILEWLEANESDDERGEGEPYIFSKDLREALIPPTNRPPEKMVKPCVCGNRGYSALVNNEHFDGCPNNQ